jgi:hypothetical protein
MTQKELALYLGISSPMVTRLKGRGMPVHSVFAAREWRATNLDPSLRKEIRRPDLPGPRRERDPVFECHELGELAYRALELGRSTDFVMYVEQLRSAWRALASKQQERVELDVDIWDALCGFRGRWTQLSGLERVRVNEFIRENE